MPTPHEFKELWSQYPELVVQMVKDELDAQGFSLSQEDVKAEITRFYNNEPTETTGPRLFIRTWLTDGMAE